MRQHINQADVIIGHTYACRVSRRIVPGTIFRRFWATSAYDRHKSMHFLVFNHVTRRTIELCGTRRLLYELPICAACSQPITGAKPCPKTTPPPHASG